MPTESLATNIKTDQIECLNEQENATARSMFEGGGSLKSDVDEELLITVPFQSGVRIHNMLIEGPEGKAPSSVKLFVDQLNLDFETANNTPATQQFELDSSKTKAGNGEKLNLKIVRFKNVHTLTIYIPGNQADDEETVINSIKFEGEVLHHKGSSEGGEVDKRLAGLAPGQ
eukprot:gb/GECH01010041.1/.p1 GENE.gb/GECH01010041.1/~~gb/GECH01010041.1/.p1  ORF type:complete len:172 (+),score=46.08 gb/GECH01010041.1/:1-516(+)